MKQVVVTRPVEVALRSLDEENRRRVHTWFDHLAHWQSDDFVRSHSHRLDTVPGVYVLRTGTDLRIFFAVEKDTITILDIGKKQSILTSAQGPEAE